MHWQRRGVKFVYMRRIVELERQRRERNINQKRNLKLKLTWRWRHLLLFSRISLKADLSRLLSPFRSSFLFLCLDFLSFIFCSLFDWSIILFVDYRIIDQFTAERWSHISTLIHLSMSLTSASSIRQVWWEKECSWLESDGHRFRMSLSSTGSCWYR